MNRRGFLRAMVGGLAIAAARTYPFRVFSFPTEIRPAFSGGLDLGSTGDWTAYSLISILPADAEFLESRSFMASEIAAQFRVPSERLLA
jgi:hypothetical protein